MWMSAILGMALRCAESALSVLHRRSSNGVRCGGPMYVMRDMGLKFMPMLFAVCGIIVSFVMADALPSGALASALKESYGVPTLLTGALLSAVTAATVCGGAKRIAAAASFTVPVVTLFFTAAGLWVILTNLSAAGAALAEIFTSAFSLKAGLGGLLGTAVRQGLSKGVYSNEAGMGTEPMLAAATDEPSARRQALISMTAPFLDTIVFCSFTAVIAVMAPPCGSAASMVSDAFAYFLPGCGRFVVASTLALLVVATLTSSAFYGECCLGFLTSRRGARVCFRIVYSLVPLIFAGAELDILTSLADISTALMAIPNLIICLLSITEVKRAFKGEIFGLSSVDKHGKIVYINTDRITHIQDGDKANEKTLCN